MSGIGVVLDGLEAALELERELGVRSFPFDRSLLSPLPAAVTPAAVAAAPLPQPPSTPAERPVRTLPQKPVVRTPAGNAAARFVFLHDRPLSEAGAEIVRKAVAALGAPPEAAEVAFDGELPAAAAYVVLGRNALRKWFPEVRATRGQWVSAPSAREVLVTYSPDYILRFGDSPAVRTMKRELWNDIKSVPARTIRDNK